MQNSFLSHADAALRNRNNILHYLKNHGPISRTDIWENMNISRASVTQVIRQLQDNNLILESGQGESTGGRRPQYISFNGAARKLYAFDWTSRTLCLMDLGGKILVEKNLFFQRGVRPMAFAVAVRNEIEKIDAMGLCPADDVIGFGLSLPGLIDSRTGTVIYSVELGWQNVSLTELFADRFRDNLYLERTGNVMALGSYNDPAVQAGSHMQLFILGTEGIGVSTVIHGNGQHGANYMHGELGHIKLNENVICSCGQRGCLEAVVNDLMLTSGGVLTEQVLDYLSVGVATAVNISDPSTILLMGSFVDVMTPEQKNYLTCAIRDKVTGIHQRRLDIRFSHESKKLVFKGISAYAFDRYYSID